MLVRRAGRSHDAYLQLAARTAEDGVYKLTSGAFPAEARRHYRTYVNVWLNWCGLGGLEPCTCARRYRRVDLRSA